jgi:plasmid stabilization system protein ParE
MTIRKSEYFISDVEQQFQWYLANANDKIADRYLDAVEATCQLLKHHPLIGPQAGFSNPKLHDWRFIVVLRPFQKHILFYEIVGSHFGLLFIFGTCHFTNPRRLPHE